jgi:predicted  nucleic acid-binding Zn-ribbon protein
MAVVVARLLRLFGLMNQVANILQRLRKLTQLDADLRKLSRNTEEYREMEGKIESLRAPLPVSILGDYDGRKARGKLSIAAVHRGVCGACHISIPSGRVGDLRRKPGELIVCDNCGVFIYLTEDELVLPSGSALNRTPVHKTFKAKRIYARRA